MTNFPVDCRVEAFTAPCCGQRIDPSVWLRTREEQLVSWTYCPCMLEALKVTARKDVADPEEWARSEFAARIHFLDNLFPYARESRRLQRCTFAGFQPQTERQAAAKTWAEAYVAQWGPDGDQGGFLWGPVGTGKTHLLYALYAGLRARRLPALFTSVPRLLLQIKRTFDGSGDQTAMERAVVEAPVLCLDDIGVEKPTEWVLETLYLWIDTRYQAGRPVVLTSNWSPKDLKVRLNDRIVSRLVAQGTVLRVDGPDHRVVPQ